MRKIKMISLGRSCMVSLTAAYIKIASHYFQIISGLKYFSTEYNSPSLVVDYLGDSFSKTSFSLDCFLESSFGNIIAINKSRILWVHFNAFMYLVIFSIGYGVLVLLRIVSRKRYIWTNALILFSIFTQYSIVSLLAQAASCRTVSNRSFEKLSLSLECWGNDHKELFY